MSIASLDNRKRFVAQEAGEALVAQVLAAVAGIRFGSVELVIHDGRVTQIERRERMRLTRPGSEGAID